MTEIQIDSIIKQLQKVRPIYHSEADLQHALAWEIHLHYPSARVRLEVNKGVEDQREYLDILVRERNTSLAVELKYKTRKLNVIFEAEEFHLRNQAAQDIGRYDFIKDITRLERFADLHGGTAGCAIFLTNDDNYWKKAQTPTTVDAMFRIHENRVLNGELAWGEAASAGTISGRERPLVLRGSYAIHWVDYSQLDAKGPGKFRYVLLEVGGSRG